MVLAIVYLLVNISVGALACFFGKRLFYVVLGLLVVLGVFNVALSSTDGSMVSFVVAAVLEQGGGGSATASRAIRDVLGVIYDAPDTSSDSGNSAVR